MQDNVQPSPDELLAAIQKEEKKAQRGKLKIFLGMCAGVGKTYAMLRATQQRKTDGVHVVVGIVETHGRKETEVLLENLQQIPLKTIEYRGVQLKEFDLDSVLVLRPQLVLVDELAHTNVPGVRHPKRYQDILELLDAGISVYTTLNIQHVESRVDVVRQITGITIQETVPDSILDQADEIELVDLTPEQLQKRLADGKVYLGERAVTAADHFFREENLTALREIALRYTAEHVGQDLRDVMGLKKISGPWKTSERLLVAISSSPFSGRLVRWTRRIAAAMDAPWMVAYVETDRVLGEGEEANLAKNLSLARQLGSEVVTEIGQDLVGTLLKIAREKNVTQIVVGKPLENRLIQFFRGGSLADQLIRRSGDIDICVVRAEKTPVVRQTWFRGIRGITRPREILIGFMAVSAVTAFSLMIQSFTGYWAVALVYLLLIVILATKFSRTTTFLIAAMSAILWNFLFIPPKYTFCITHLHDVLMFVMYFVVALVIGQLTSRIRLREIAERKREQRTQALYRLAQAVVESTNLDDSLHRALRELEILINGQSAVLLADEDGKLKSTAHWAGHWNFSEKDQSVATWSFFNNKPAGRFTDTLPESQALFLPLRTAKTKVGVLAIGLENRKSLDLDERELLETFADQIAAIVERYGLIQQVNRAQLSEEAERLYKTLFDSVSHELKTPLTIISGAINELELYVKSQGEAQTFVNEIQTATRRLNRVVENLLDMTRIEAGRLKLAMDWCDVSDLIRAARDQVSDLLAKHRVLVSASSDLPTLKVDFGLMQHALANLLANAAIYSEKGTEIHVSAKVDGDWMLIKVIDQGQGLPKEVSGKIFDKFYRGPNAEPGGTGLGLSIVKSLVQAHGGTVSAENNPDRGATFTFQIPLIKYEKDSVQ